MSTKQSLAALFEKAGLRQGATAAHARIDVGKLSRELFCRTFAESYVRNGFDAKKAYQSLRRVPKDRIKNQCWQWMKQRRVQQHIRMLVQETTEETKGLLRLDVAELVELNEALLSADICDYIESATEYVPYADGFKDPQGNPGTYRTFNRLAVDPNKLTTAQRMSIRKITMKEGEVTSIEIVDKLNAMTMQAALIELLQARNGSDNTWVGSFQARMKKARDDRIAAEVRAGKVAMLPVAKKA